MTKGVIAPEIAVSSGDFFGEPKKRGILVKSD